MKQKKSLENYGKRIMYTIANQNEPYIGLAFFRKRKINNTQEETPDSENTFEGRLKQNARGFIIHLMFLILVSIIAIGMASIDHFYYTDLTEQLFYKTPPNPPEKGEGSVTPSDDTHETTSPTIRKSRNIESIQFATPFSAAGSEVPSSTVNNTAFSDFLPTYGISSRITPHPSERILTRISKSTLSGSIPSLVVKSREKRLSFGSTFEEPMECVTEISSANTSKSSMVIRTTDFSSTTLRHSLSSSPNESNFNSLATPANTTPRAHSSIANFEPISNTTSNINRELRKNLEKNLSVEAVNAKFHSNMITVGYDNITLKNYKKMAVSRRRRKAEKLLLMNQNNSFTPCTFTNEFYQNATKCNFTLMNDDIFLSSMGVVTRAKREGDDLNCRCCPRKSLEESRTVSDFWEFAETTLIQLLYWNFWYHYMVSGTHFADEDKENFFENQIMGLPRIRQVRVKSDSCSIHPSVSRFFDECYSHYSLYSEETRPIREDMGGTYTQQAWVYTSYTDLKTTYYTGTISTYGGGGYYLDLSLDIRETMYMIGELKKYNWITRSTRAVFIDFTLYNVNVNLFCVCKIVFEFPPSGGIIPKADFASVKLLRYLTAWDFFILGCELFFIIFVIFLTVCLIRRIKEFKRQFFLSFWSYVDIFILTLSYAFIAFGIARYIIVDEFLQALPTNTKTHVDFWYVRNVQIWFNYLTATLVFFAWVQLVQYLNFTQTMMELRSTLRKSIWDIFGFAVLFFIIFFAFAQVAFLMFGNQLEDYSSLWSSCLTLFQAVIGEFEYKQLEEVNRVLAPIFFVVFIFFIFFVLMNMFLAIINDAYAAVKSEVDLDRVKTEEYLRNVYWNILALILRGKEKKFRKPSSKRQTYMEIKRHLQRSGFSEAEIDIFFRLYSIDLDRMINETENRRIINDLELKGLDFNVSEDQARIEELTRNLDRLNEKVLQMQRSLQPLMHKIDLILTRLTL